MVHYYFPLVSMKEPSHPSCGSMISQTGKKFKGGIGGFLRDSHTSKFQTGRIKSIGEFYRRIGRKDSKWL